MASPPPQAAETASYAHFSWPIVKFSTLGTEKLYSKVFYVGGCQWRILVYPAGNNTNHLSMFLDVADSETLPVGWNRKARFSLAVINPIDYTLSIRKEADVLFKHGESNWGYRSFAPLGGLKDPTKPYLLNDTLFVEADVTVESVVEYSLVEEVPSLERSKKRKTEQGGFEEGSYSSKDTAPLFPDEAKMPPAAPTAGRTVDFLSYRVSSEAFVVLEKIHNHHKNTFTKFSMKAPIIQTALLESFAFFIDSLSTTKVSEMNEDALCSAAVSVKDFEEVGLDLSWLNQRLDETKTVNKHLESVSTIDSYVKALDVARAKVHELEEKLAKAKAEEAEVVLPKSLGGNDYVLAGVF